MNRERKHFSCCCLQSFTTEEIIQRHLKECFQINGKKE